MTKVSHYWHPSERQIKNSEISSHSRKLQNLLGKKRSLIRETFQNEALGGAKAAKNFSRFSDRIILEHIIPLTELAKRQEKNWAICATEIFGTGYLSPFDPLNLILIYKGKASSRLKKEFESFLYLLWIAGFRLQAEIISFEDTPKKIPMPLRFIFGEKEILSEFKKENHILFQKQIHKLIEKKIKSLYGQQNMFAFNQKDEEKFSPIRSILEFDHILNFLHSDHLSEFFQFQKKPKNIEGENFPLSILIENKILLPNEITLFHFIWRFLWTVRFHLHYLTNRPQKNLTPFLQPLIAAKMKYPGTRNENYQDQFMRHYFLSIRMLERLERTVDPMCFRKISPSLSIAQRIFLTSPQNMDNPITILRTLEKANLTRKSLHPEDISLIIRSSSKLRNLIGDPEASRILLNLIRKAPLFLGKYFLNNAGILSAMIPPWQRFFGITRISPKGTSYLLDQECLNVVNILTLLEYGFFQKKAPLASKLFKTISEWKALYLAALLQKIGETIEIDSYVESAAIGRNIAAQLGLSEAEQETVYWLILHRDILHESIHKTENIKEKMRNISRKIQSPSRLKLIYLLTIADIMSSRNDISTNWDESLLQKTYFRLCNRLRGNIRLKQRDVLHIKQQKEMLQKFLDKNTDHKTLKEYLNIGSYEYWSKFSTEEQREHFNLFHEYLNSSLKIKYHIQIHQQETIITIMVPDLPDVLSYLTKRLHEIQVNINYAEFYAFPSIKTALFILHSPWYGGIVETIEESIQNLTILLKFAFDEDAKNFEKILTENAFPELEKYSILPQKERILSPAHLYFDHHFFDNRLFIEINGRDSKGCLARICATFSKHKIRIKQANIRTYGVRITNTFHVTDQNEQKITDQKLLAHFQDDITNILNRNFDN
ncbi:hypothetical protein FAI41_08855 [Acetobacteraceae bacterium]|nr:hypothetical protein FAI41_08855 [Acetobacteraceae bacterium]